MRLERRPNYLETERLMLRPHSRENYPLYADWYADEDIWRLSSWRSTPMSAEETRQLFEERDRSKGDASYAIHVKGLDAPVGVTGLMNMSPCNSSADLFIIIGDPEARGKGYGTEAISAIIDHGFDDLDLNRVGLSVFDFNESAIRVYERIGFSEEGCMRRAIKRDGAFHDAILMSLLKSEWRRRP